ncbi:MAG: hypothetical protein RBG13Loki_3016 [Promethearchaeota archaeon CR_4]|nr:MAG: hypothetical protein RBG13Loki_3016 [Candidatus Lokiarchaeota archaeon CR_4]
MRSIKEFRVQKQELLDKFAIPVGCLSCTVGILLGIFGGSGWNDFLAGMCMGLSIVLNLYGLYHYSRNKALQQATSISTGKICQ